MPVRMAKSWCTVMAPRISQPTVYEGASEEVRVGGVFVSRFLVLRVDGVKEDNADLNSDLAVTMVVTVEVDRRALTGLAAFGVGGSPDTTHDTTVPRHNIPIGN